MFYMPLTSLCQAELFSILIESKMFEDTAALSVIVLLSKVKRFLSVRNHAGYKIQGDYKLSLHI
jgi:hypothetical protein